MGVDRGPCQASLVFSVAQLLACGGILAGFGIPFKWGVVITAVVILVYCTVGGMWGVVLTDVIQTGVIVIGIPILFIAVIYQFINGGGSLASIYATPFIPEGMGTKFIYLVLPFFLSTSVSYDAYSRIQSAKDAKTARLGCIIGGTLVYYRGNAVLLHRRSCCEPFPRRDRRYFYCGCHQACCRRCWRALLLPPYCPRPCPVPTV